MSADKPSGPKYRETGPEHFSPLADRRTPANQIPPCAGCGEPSIGAHILRAVASTAPTFDVVFQCGACGTWPFEIMSTALNPHYHVIPSGDRGYARVRRLSRDEAIRRVTA